MEKAKSYVWSVNCLRPSRAEERPRHTQRERAKPNEEKEEMQRFLRTRHSVSGWPRGLSSLRQIGHTPLEAFDLQRTRQQQVPFTPYISSFSHASTFSSSTYSFLATPSIMLLHARRGGMLVACCSVLVFIDQTHAFFPPSALSSSSSSAAARRPGKYTFHRKREG